MMAYTHTDKRTDRGEMNEACVWIRSILFTECTFSWNASSSIVVVVVAVGAVTDDDDTGGDGDFIVVEGGLSSESIMSTKRIASRPNGWLPKLYVHM